MASLAASRSSAAAKVGVPAKSARVARVVPRASLGDNPKMYKETGAEAPLAAAGFNLTTTPFDNYKFAPIREATVSPLAAVGAAACWLTPACGDVCL